ncbi:2-methoxy-6-polyprenyl-1,4-benzoquinol methylase [subsurface metagenome]
MPPEIIKEDYNSLASTYDEYFSNFTRPHSQELVKKLNINNDVTVLDLACGTGTITAELRKYMSEKGRILAVDSSEQMVKKAKEKITEKNVEFICGDMLEILDEFQDNSFDCVTCGWAIGYASPLKLLKKIKRVLKQNGKIGIIENRKDTLSPLRETGIKVMQRYPQHIRYIMDLTLRLPRDKGHLEGLYKKAGLKSLEVWEGEVRFNFKDGHELLNWALHTGASAGFNRMMDPKAKDKCDNAFIEIIERDYKTTEGINISHKYVAGIAEKT